MVEVLDRARCGARSVRDWVWPRRTQQAVAEDVPCPQSTIAVRGTRWADGARRVAIWPIRPPRARCGWGGGIARRRPGAAEICARNTEGPAVAVWKAIARASRARSNSARGSARDASSGRLVMWGAPAQAGSSAGRPEPGAARAQAYACWARRQSRPWPAAAARATARRPVMPGTARRRASSLPVPPASRDRGRPSSGECRCERAQTLAPSRTRRPPPSPPA